MHSECKRPAAKSNVDRMSRHWYDLAQLSISTIGLSAIEDWSLLEDVVNQKNVLYYAGFSDYETCLTGGLQLVPEGELAVLLSKDFAKMESEGMFWQAPGSFENVLKQLAKIQDKINDKFSKRS